MFLWTQVILKRLLTLKLPFSKLPNAALDHRTNYVRLLIEIIFVTLNVILSAFPDLFDYLNIISLIIFVISFALGSLKIMMVPVYQKTLNIFINVSNWAVVSCSFIILINAFDEDLNELNLYYLAIISPFMIGFSFILEFHW